MSHSSAIPSDDLHRHAAFLRALARGILKDEQLCEDVVQQVFVRALLDPPGDGGALRTWLARVTQRVALNTARERSRRKQREQACARAEAVNEAAGLELVVQRRILEAVDALDEPYRSTIYLRYYRGATPTEIARELGLPLKTVEARLTRAHRILRERLDRTLRTERGVMTAFVLPAVTSRATEAGTLLGGLLMSKNALLVVVALVAAGGIWLARRDASPTRPAREDQSSSTALSTAAGAPDRSVEVAESAVLREVISTSSPHDAVADPITVPDGLAETIEGVLDAIESSFSGTFDPGAVLDGALLLALHDFGPAIPEPNQAGMLVFPMLDAPGGVEAELRVAKNRKFETVLQLEMRFETPRAPWLLDGRPHEEPHASVAVWTNDGGELLNMTVSTGAEPAMDFPFAIASEVPYGAHLHTDMSDPSAWRLSMGGLRPAATDEATGNRSWTSSEWEVPQVLDGTWPRTAEMEELARRPEHEQVVQVVHHAVLPEEGVRDARRGAGGADDLEGCVDAARFAVGAGHEEAERDQAGGTVDVEEGLHRVVREGAHADHVAVHVEVERLSVDRSGERADLERGEGGVVPAHGVEGADLRAGGAGDLAAGVDGVGAAEGRARDQRGQELAGRGGRGPGARVRADEVAVTRAAHHAAGAVHVVRGAREEAVGRCEQLRRALLPAPRLLSRATDDERRLVEAEQVVVVGVGTLEEPEAARRIEQVGLREDAPLGLRRVQRDDPGRIHVEGRREDVRSGRSEDRDRVARHALQGRRGRSGEQGE